VELKINYNRVAMEFLYALLQAVQTELPPTDDCTIETCTPEYERNPFFKDESCHCKQVIKCYFATYFAGMLVYNFNIKW